MTHINDLDPEVLYRILCFTSGELAKDIGKWKNKLTLLQVCTKWYDLFKNYIFSQGFVDICPPGNIKDLGNDIGNTCVYYADNDIICRSNLGIITERDKYNCNYVSELKVKAIKFHHIGQFSHVLKELLALGVGYWLNLSSLSLTVYCNDNPLLEPKINLEAVSATVSKHVCFFQNQAPNITHLYFDCHFDKMLVSSLPLLIDLYAPRLQSLYFDYPINKYPLPLFSTDLTSLSLNLLHYTFRHPSFHAKPLQYLRISNLYNRRLLWWIFHDFTKPGCVEFTNLKTLNLMYTRDLVEARELSKKNPNQARPYGSRMLRFPKLQNLTLSHPPVDCDVLFTDTVPTHLEELNIKGGCDSVVATSRLGFNSVNKMIIEIFLDISFNSNFYIAADRYFGYTKIESTCTANINLSIDVQRTVSWVNITNLRLLNIRLDELLDLLHNLYKLQNLRVRDVSLSGECQSIIRSGLGEEEQGNIGLLDTKLEHLLVFRIDPDNPQYLLALLNHLILRTTTLRHVEIRDKLYSHVMKSFLPERFQHINFIRNFGIFL